MEVCALCVLLVGFLLFLVFFFLFLLVFLLLFSFRLSSRLLDCISEIHLIVFILFLVFVNFQFLRVLLSWQFSVIFEYKYNIVSYLIHTMCILFVCGITEETIQTYRQ